MPQEVFADQQACEKLVAVSYLDASLDIQQPVDQQQLQKINTDFLKALESYLPPVFILETASTTFPKGIPRP